MKSRSTGALALLACAAIAVVAVQALHVSPSRPATSSPRSTSRIWMIHEAICPAYSGLEKAAGGRLVAAGQNIVSFEGAPPGTRVAINEFDGLEAAQAWRASTQNKEDRKVGEKYAKFRSFAVEGLPK